MILAYSDIDRLNNIMRSPVIQRQCRDIFGDDVSTTPSGILLMTAFRSCGIDPSILKSICYGSWGKPYLYNSPIYFSNSRSDRIFICGISIGSEIGADVEVVSAPLDVHDFESILSPVELNFIGKGGSALRLWTRKESIAKALGTGLHEDLQYIETVNDSVQIANTTWYFQNPTDIPDCEISICTTNNEEATIRLIE